jgi:hypothetical protein
MSAQDKQLLNPRAVADRVTVLLNPPPCEREFVLSLRPNGDLRWVCIDGVYYSATRLKTSGRLYEGDRRVRIVDVYVRTP